jgi:hypothetical protein
MAYTVNVLQGGGGGGGEHYNKLNGEQCEIQRPKNGVAKDSSHLGCDDLLLGEEFSAF